MNSHEIFSTALQYEQKIRDFYHSAAEKVDDQRGKSIFIALADDEQSHVDFLNYSLKQLKTNGAIDIDRLVSPIPTLNKLVSGIEHLKAEIPEQMLGDIKSVLASALKLEKETSAFYRDACSKTDGEIKTIFEKFLEIEDRHVDVVQIELDHAQNNGMWFNFMEVNLEANRPRRVYSLIPEAVRHPDRNHPPSDSNDVINSNSGGDNSLFSFDLVNLRAYYDWRSQGGGFEIIHLERPGNIPECR